MPTPQNDQVETAACDSEVPAGAGSAGARGRTAAAVGGLAVLLAGAIVAGAVVGRSSIPARVAGPAATTTPQSGRIAPASASASAPATGPAAPTTPNTGKVAPPAMSTRQYDTTRTELTALAARLPAHLTLTAPATWAQYAGQTPTYTEDIVSCPHIADRLAADLGARWTYTFGKLPAGPGGCFWTPVPWVPDVSRFFVSIGYESGDVPSLMQGMDYCAGGVDAPRVAVPAVARGAVLYGCDDANGPAYDLAVPDTGGTGAFFLHSSGGAQHSPSRVADALLAVIDGATHAYG